MSKYINYIGDFHFRTSDSQIPGSAISSHKNIHLYMKKGGVSAPSSDHRLPFPSFPDMDPLSLICCVLS